ncbi:MAG TPA: DUF3565 domain-containing protein [Acidimicrobiales bacterium]|nr:DUF3565 domain-containing protein [Acidimicrobiales bacterium]
MERAIVGFHPDGAGNWVAELECGHDQHVYHRPPFQVRPWVLDAAGREGRLGTPLGCPLCDRAELPAGLRPEYRSPPWSARTVPAEVLQGRRAPDGSWARIVVEEGHVAVGVATARPMHRALAAGEWQAVPPGTAYELAVEGDAKFRVELLGVARSAWRSSSGATEALELDAGDGEGGETACWAHLLCPVCGRMTGEHPGGVCPAP